MSDRDIFADLVTKFETIGSVIESSGIRKLHLSKAPI